jgi:serine/threonine protein kinase
MPSTAGNTLAGGTKLQGGHFTVGKVLGQGGFGITYLGSDTRLKRPIAIKEYFPHGCAARRSNTVVPTGIMTAADYQSAKVKFLEEAHVLAQFQHPGIVHVYTSFEEYNTAYVVMEYLKGKTLSGVLGERGPLPEGQAVDCIATMGDALTVVHQANLLHRDIKPENVIMTDEGRVVLVDFGTAREFAAGKTKQMTAMLTPGYAPLEQYGQQARFGPFTDIYALGATLYHLLTGHVPVHASDRAMGVRLPSPQELNATVSPAVSDAVMWAMEIKVEHRPQAVPEFLGALRGLVPPKRPAAPRAVPQNENIPEKNLDLAKKKELPRCGWVIGWIVLFGILLSGILLYLGDQTPQVARKPASTAVATSNKYVQQEKKGQGTHVVYPGERVGNFVLGMTKEQVMKLGKPHFRYNLSDRVENWTYQNKKNGNTLSATFSNNILTSVCFTSDKFDTIEGITTANFDKPHEQLVSNPPKSNDELMGQVGVSPKMSPLRARYNYRTGGLVYTLDSNGQRQGCVFKQ